MDYVGEHLMPGKLGQFFVVLSFAGSLVAMHRLFQNGQCKIHRRKQFLEKNGALRFLVNTISVFIVFATIFYIIKKHYFEYNFAWEHSSRNLDPKYMLSLYLGGAGRELFTLDDVDWVLGMILMFACPANGRHPVMTVISFAQFCLATMILGVYCFRYRSGINPFMLVRQLFQEAPIFQPRRLFDHSADAGWSESQCPSAELLDGYPSAGLIPRIFFHGRSLCICSRRVVEEGIRDLDKNCPALDSFFLLHTWNRDYDGRCLGL